jgi:hypothetical protein
MKFADKDTRGRLKIHDGKLLHQSRSNQIRYQ